MADTRPRLVFMGSPAFALPSLERLLETGYRIAAVFTQPDREVGRGRASQPPPVKRLAESAGLRVLQPESLRKPDVLQELADLRPDLIVIVAYGHILRPSVLAIPRSGTINVHASLLPRYRGPSPVVAALLDGLTETGVSIMLVDEGTDTGPVLARAQEPIHPEDTAGTLSVRLAQLGADLLVETLPRWLAGDLTPEPQNPAEASFTRLLQKDDGVINWTVPAVDIWRRVRAFNPWPGASTTLSGVAVQILQAWPVDDGTRGEPGRIQPFKQRLNVPANLPRPTFAVQTGSGLLLPLYLQKAGRRALAAGDFLNGERGLLQLRFGA